MQRERKAGAESKSSRELSSDEAGGASSSGGSNMDHVGNLLEARVQRASPIPDSPRRYQTWIMLELCSLGSLQVTLHGDAG